MARALVSTPFIPISRFPHSHRGAQGVIYADMIQRAKDIFQNNDQAPREKTTVTCNMSLDLYHADFNEFDELWVYHGNDWTNHLNLFGGLQNFPYAYNFENFCRFKGPVYSLGIDFPDYRAMLEHKIRLAVDKGKHIQPEWLRVDWDNLSRMQSTAHTVRHPLLSRNLVLGDSHSICLYRPGWTVESIPFKTLYGALKTGLKNLLPAGYDGSWDRIDIVDLYFGNIDVRHHLCRQPDPVVAAHELAELYVGQAYDLSCHGQGRVVTIHELLPIENESRTIPKTGYYEGKPFHGSWEERNAVRNAFNDHVGVMVQDLKAVSRERGWVDFKRWTGHLLNSRGELDFKKMERPKSIHLSRDAYPYWQGREWNGPSDATIEDLVSEEEAE